MVSTGDEMPPPTRNKQTLTRLQENIQMRNIFDTFSGMRIGEINGTIDKIITENNK
jgi:hypothetical protein